MKMTLRYFGPTDPIPLSHIRQIAGVKGVVSTLYDTTPGEVWTREGIRSLKSSIEDAGLELSGIESVNVHDAIKIGCPARRDMYIENYIKSLEALGEEGVQLVCYNFMPVFDWTRSDLAKMREDGATVLSYEQAKIDAVDPERLFESINENSNGLVLPGWEPERMEQIKQLFLMYQGVDNEKLFANLVYFLKAIMPVCNKYDIKMAIHQDDPSWSVFGLPRIISSGDNLVRMLEAVDDPHNGVTLCTGSLSSNPNNDVCEIIPRLKGRIYFAHVRNIRQYGNGNFDEAAHYSADGSLDMFKIMKTLYDSGFDGVIRPDHGRAVWGEGGMPGYGLYDRAMGASYLNGIWESLEKLFPRK